MQRHLDPLIDPPVSSHPSIYLSIHPYKPRRKEDRRQRHPAHLTGPPGSSDNSSLLSHPSIDPSIHPYKPLGKEHRRQRHPGQSTGPPVSSDNSSMPLEVEGNGRCDEVHYPIMIEMDGWMDG